MKSIFKRMVSKITKEDVIYEYLCCLRDLAQDFNLSNSDRRKILVAFPIFDDDDWLLELKQRCSTHYTFKGQILLYSINNIMRRNSTIDFALTDAFVLLCGFISHVNGEINKCSHAEEELNNHYQLLRNHSDDIFGEYHATAKQLQDCYKQLVTAYDEEIAIGKAAINSLYSWNQQLQCLFQTGSNRSEINTSSFLKSYLRSATMQSAIALRHYLAPVSDHYPDSFGQIIYGTVKAPYWEGMIRQRNVIMQRATAYSQCVAELKQQIRTQARAQK